jgi:hypothetical protein
LKGVKFSEIGDEELGQNNNEPWHLDVQWAPSGKKIKSRYSPISATHRTDVEVETEFQDYESEYPEYEQEPEQQDPRFTGIAHANSWFINQDQQQREAALQEFEEIAKGDQETLEERVKRERMELERLQQACRDDMDDRLLDFLGY